MPQFPFFGVVFVGLSCCLFFSCFLRALFLYIFFGFRMCLSLCLVLFELLLVFWPVFIRYLIICFFLS